MHKTAKSFKQVNYQIPVKNHSSQSSSITEDFSNKTKRKKISRLHFLRTIIKNSLESFCDKVIQRENMTVDEQLIFEIKKPIYVLAQRGSTTVKKLNYEKDLYVSCLI